MEGFVLENQQNEMDKKNARMLERCDALEAWAEKNPGVSFRTLRQSKNDHERSLFWFYHRTFRNPAPRVREIPDEVKLAIDRVTKLDPEGTGLGI